VILISLADALNDESAIIITSSGFLEVQEAIGIPLLCTTSIYVQRTTVESG
jgi:hypothetical protein